MGESLCALSSNSVPQQRALIPLLNRHKGIRAQWRGRHHATKGAAYTQKKLL